MVCHRSDPRTPVCGAGPIVCRSSFIWSPYSKQLIYPQVLSVAGRFGCLRFVQDGARPRRRAESGCPTALVIFSAHFIGPCADRGVGAQGTAEGCDR
jgi:hypothetical protein